MAPLAPILVGLVGNSLAAVAVFFWPQIMTWAREHLLPWVDRNVPELARSVRLAFQDLDKIAVELRRAVRTAWRKLRGVLLSETATFVAVANGEWAVRITSYLRNVEQADQPVVKVVTDQQLNWEDLPAEVRAAAMSDGLLGKSIDILKARDLLLTETV
jgi:hypothetical protein